MRKKTDISELSLYQDEWKVRLRFMHQGYRPGCEFFEVWELFRKATLAGGMVFLYPETATQLYGGALVTFASFAIHESWRPFREEDVAVVSEMATGPIVFLKQCARRLASSENSQQSISLAVLWFDVYIGYSLKVETPTEDKWNFHMMALFVLIVNTCVILMEPLFALFEFFDEPEENLRMDFAAAVKEQRRKRGWLAQLKKLAAINLSGRVVSLASPKACVDREGFDVPSTRQCCMI